MIFRKELAIYLDELLACDQFEDYAPNGIQVEGKPEIERICTAVTASAEAIERAVALQADALLVHHGYFWRGETPVLIGMKRERIAKLINHQLSLFAYHLPLDCHSQFGNNACFGRLLKAAELTSHRIHKISDLLWSGVLPQEVSAEELAGLLNKELNRPPLVVGGSGKAIRTLAWCTGAAQDLIEQAHALGVDAFLSGEISERTYYQAKELGLYYFACGHHASERFGVQALGEHLASQFDLRHFFIDSSNPV